jgi:hypothetical protein
MRVVSNPPANVDVADVDVALKEGASMYVAAEKPVVERSPPVKVEVAVVGETSVPEIERMPPDAIERVVPESKVRVPEVKLSVVFERRKLLSATPLSVFASSPAHVLSERRKHPAVSCMPCAKVELAVARDFIAFVPLIVIPLVERRPAVPTPPANVDVATPPTWSVEDAWSTPCTRKLPLTVEEAEDTNPLILPRASIEKSVLDAMSWMMNALPE